MEKGMHREGERERERGEQRMTERERDIFSGAVGGGDIMEHNWRGVCLCVCVWRRGVASAKRCDKRGKSVFVCVR